MDLDKWSTLVDSLRKLALRSAALESLLEVGFATLIKADVMAGLACLLHFAGATASCLLWAFVRRQNRAFSPTISTQIIHLDCRGRSR